MGIATGTRLGSYEITGVIGAGGMGEVYRARDTKLNREVAIKVLPDLFADDPDRLARFEREAQMLAALNHTNIAQVHGVIEIPTDRGSHAAGLVMELVDGDDLAQRIARGAIPLDEALTIAKQIADALEAAHERGIIHRDLKPANIKVREDGHVKVLDFGLAKAIETRPGEAGHLVNSPTFTSPAHLRQGYGGQATELGVILGTAAYMAPEQAKGKTVDKRADIWAFGVVLSEMLIGRPIFVADTTSELLAAVMMREPDLTGLPSDTPTFVRSLISRCLQKDPRQRLRDIGEARLLLASPPPPDVRVPGEVRPRSWVPRWAWALGGAVAGAVIVWLVAGRGTSPAADVPGTFSLRRLTELPGPELQPDISPDGRHVVFASAASGNRDVYVLRVGAGRALNLTPNSPADDEQATFSPDGERIAFRSEREGGGIFVMGATGESVRRVTTAGYDPAWSPDGASLAYTTEPVSDPYARNARSELSIVEIASGKTRRVIEGDAVQAVWSPDGGRIAYWANTGGQRDIWTVAAAGGTPVAATQDIATDWSPEWSPDGRWLYFSSDRGGTMNIWRIGLDQQSGATRGEPQPITSSLAGVAYARFAADARRVSVMAYSRSSELLVAPFDDTGGGRVGETAAIRSPSLGWCAPSPDGGWLACTSRTAQEEIVLMRADGSEMVRLTDDPSKDRNPSWSPDGTRVAFMSTRSGQWELWSVRKDGSDVRQMTDFRADAYAAVWSPDGRQALSGASVQRPFGFWIFDVGTVATRSTATFVKNTTDEIFNPEAWSPDGTRVAGSMLDGTGEVRTPAIWDRASGALRVLDVPRPKGNYFAVMVAGWLPDSRRFVVASGIGLALVDASTGQWTTIPSPTGASRYGLSANGRTLMIERDAFDADVWLMEFK